MKKLKINFVKIINFLLQFVKIKYNYHVTNNVFNVGEQMANPQVKQWGGSLNLANVVYSNADCFSDKTGSY